jgi:serine/threonine protein kinase
MIGETVGNFRVIRKLGQGGMGEVLLAEHKDIQTKVAIKMLLPHISADKQHVQRFFNEAVAVSKIKHAGITKIFDVGYLANGTAYLVMELLEGESLAHRIARTGRLPADQVADIVRQIASVLEATHREGVIHRDLKPDNVFLVPDHELSSGERVKVLDFGIAKLGTTGMTQNNSAMGTPAYMSPEQWRNATKVDGRADLYSLGCLAFESVCGRPPFVSESMGELCTMHLNDMPPTVRSIAPDVPPSFEALVMRLLAKTPDERGNVRETKLAFTQLAADYRGVSAETMMPSGTGSHVPIVTPSYTPPITAEPKPTTLGSSAMQLQREPPPVRRSKTPFVIGACVLVAGGITVAVIASQRGHETKVQQAAVTSDAPAVVPAPPPPAVGSAEPAVATVKLHLEATPAEAQIVIDSGFVANPFDGVFPKNDVRHRIEVRAEGYKPETRWVTFDAHQRLTIVLDKEAAAVPVAVTKPGTKPPVTKPLTKPPVTPPPVTPATTGSATVAAPPPPTTGSGKATYKGTKGTIITDYPPN